MIDTSRFSRRTVLGSIALGVLGFSGCSESIGNGGTSESPFASVGVEGTDIVVELAQETTVDSVNVIQPDGELFAQRQVAAGVRRETFPLGTDYEQGEYEILGLDGEEQVGAQTLDIRPDVRITDVKLARNHPEEMYEGAYESDILAEAIVTVRNDGTGPDAVTQLRFEGDVPLPTRDIFQESGIYDTKDELGGHAGAVVIGAGEELTLFSSSRPFSPAGGNVSCNEEGFSGQFTVVVATNGSDSTVSRKFGVLYEGVDLYDCNITIGED